MTGTIKLPSRRASRSLPEAAPETIRAFEEAALPEMVGRGCALQPYDRDERPKAIEVTGKFIAYASPDCTFAVTKALFEKAEESILIGIYDFTADYVKEWLLAAMQRGVRVTLMLDLDNRPGETPLFKELAKHGARAIPAPSCASKHEDARYFPSCHEKVIVIDDRWVIVQSGNYSDNSIPPNEADGRASGGHFYPGNRDMGIAVDSPELGKFFRRVLERDMKYELRESGRPEAAPRTALAPEEGPLEAFIEAPSSRPPRLFKSRRFTPRAPVSVLPVLTPDNYMEAIPEFLRSARRSVWIEQQYIRGDQALVSQLLAAIADARENVPKLDVRVIVAPPFPSKKTYEREAKKILALAEQGLRVGKELRILNPKYFVHCHNKLIIVDGRAVLVSSQNWSDTAVGTNREAGLLIRAEPIAGYYADIFQLDWETGLTRLPKTYSKTVYRAEAFAAGGLVPLNWGDYAEV